MLSLKLSVAVGASRTQTFLGARYRRLTRRGKKKAIVAVGRSILTIAWHPLADPNARYHDLGPDYFDRRANPDRVRRTHVRALQAQGSSSRSPPPPDRPGHHDHAQPNAARTRSNPSQRNRPTWASLPTSRPNFASEWTIWPAEKCQIV